MPAATYTVVFPRECARSIPSCTLPQGCDWPPHVAPASLPPTKTKIWLDQIVSGTSGIDKILGALVQYSLSQRHSAYTFTRVSVQAALLSAIASLEQEIKSKNAEVNFDPLPHTEGDLDRLADLFRHLDEVGVRSA